MSNKSFWVGILLGVGLLCDQHVCLGDNESGLQGPKTLRKPTVSGKPNVSGPKVSRVGFDGKSEFEKDKSSRAKTNLPQAVVSDAMPVVAFHPQRVRDLAQKEAGPRFASEKKQDQFAQGFMEGFKLALRSPGVRDVPQRQDNSPLAFGFARGYRLALSNAPALSVSLADYGYVYKQVEGRVALTPEGAWFYCDKEKQIWWFNAGTEVHAQYQSLLEQLSAEERQTGYVAGTIIGFLSPVGMGTFGPHGNFAREIVVDKVLTLKYEKKHAGQ